MKIRVLSSALILEDHEKFGDKKMYMQGERFKKGFTAYKETISWLVREDPNFLYEEIKENEKDELIPYIQEKATEQDYEIEIF